MAAPYGVVLRNQNVTGFLPDGCGTEPTSPVGHFTIEADAGRVSIACTVVASWSPPSDKKRALPMTARALYGAENVNRTHDLLITNQLLYQLSYPGRFASLTADRSTSNQKFMMRRRHDVEALRGIHKPPISPLPLLEGALVIRDGVGIGH